MLGRDGRKLKSRERERDIEGGTQSKRKWFGDATTNNLHLKRETVGSIHEVYPSKKAWEIIYLEHVRSSACYMPLGHGRVVSRSTVSGGEMTLVET